jgi:hypothetical protein
MSRQIPAARRASFDAIADATRCGRVAIVCTSRSVRRQYERGVAKRGGVAENLHFVVAPGMDDELADELRWHPEPHMPCIDVRSFRPHPQG